jgi:hypothetical protein
MALLRLRLTVLPLSLLLLIPLAGYGSDRLPKNSRLEVRLDENLGSDISQTGQIFTATLNRAVTLSGKEVLPKGARITGKVAYAASTFGYGRPGELELELTELAANEKTYRIVTGTLRFQGKERRIDPTTGRQDDRGARGEDAARAGIGVIGANTMPGQSIPGTGINVAPSTPVTGMQVVLPAKTKLVFNLTPAE